MAICRPRARSELPNDTAALAHYLIGKMLVRELPEGVVSGRIVETEAYIIGDAAGHAYRGMTPRNRSLFLERGHAYVYLAYGTANVLGVRVPTYNLLVIAASIAIAIGLGLFLERTRIGRIVRATAENRDMAEGLGVNASKIFALVFTVGCMLGTVGGALVVPSSAASLDMAVELVVESFAVVVIGGLGSMRGALVGALVVGLMRAAAISLVPEMEMLSVYLVVVLVLIVRPVGLFGKATA
jgi:branched-subunit amino acid ABC-type transport system permease component